MTLVILLTLYCLAIVVASLVGGYLPLVVRLTHRHLEMAISFVSGVILGVGLLHLLPHAAEALHGVEPAMAWMLGGFLLMFFLDRFFHFHLHEAPAKSDPLGAPGDEPAIHCHHGPEGHVHDLGRPGEFAHDSAHADEAASCGAGHSGHASLRHATFSWSGAAVGMTIHSVVEGIALAAAVDAEFQSDASLRIAGLGTFLAIVLHKPLDSLTVGTLMAATANTRWRCNIVNLFFALAAPCGVIAFYAFALHSADDDSRVLGPALAFAAGAFVCIASSDLLPELHFHSHDRVKLSMCLLLGVALAVLLMFVEPHDHAHALDAAAPHSQHPHDHGLHDAHSDAPRSHDHEALPAASQ